ncbi:MAG: hypothetical protein J7K04_12880 [Spirochaetales bacterium]|nr:hypothetical protein [Spirochaetales bacterium]
MTKQINYEDDIFYLLLIIKRLSDGLKLTIDADIFSGKIVDDILFLDEAVDKVAGLLKESQTFIKKEENLRNLKKVKRLFIELLDDIVNKNISIAYYFSDLIDNFKKIREKQKETAADIDEELKKLSGKKREGQQIVSEEEFKFLLSQDEDDE